MKTKWDQDRNFTITYLAQTSISKVLKKRFLEEMKTKVLGSSYNLSLVFTSKSHSKKLNRQYRKKDKVADILSFPLSKSEGEIFISPRAKNNIEGLFIHGLCHLKGMRHGSKMESEEKKYRKFFKLPNS